MRRYYIIIILLLPLLSLGQAQVGSPYTRYGLGDLYSKAFASERAMGGASLVFASGDHLNISNPASYAAMDSMTFIFDFGVETGIRLFETNTQNTTRSDAQLSHLAFGFPITKWWAASMGIKPFSNKSYSIVSSDDSYGISKNFLYYGSGGINQVFLGNGFSPIKNLRLGVNMYYYFGKQSQENAVVFNDTTGSFVNINEQNLVQINDFGFELGFQYQLNLNKNNSLLIAGVFSADNNLSAKKSSLVTNSLSTGGSAVVDTIFSSNLIKGEITLPMSIGVGLGYQYSDKFTLGVDYRMQNWSDALFFGIADSLGNSSRLSFGLDYIPAGSTGGALKYKQKVHYRMGAHYEQSYLKFNNMNSPLTDLGISFGLGLPMRRSKTSFNISFEIGQRGTIENDMIRERYAIIGIDFCLSDVWFIKRKFD